MKEKTKIAVAGLGYVGMSMAVLLARENSVTAVDIDGVKVNMVNLGMSPIAEPEIERLLSEKGALDLRATTDAVAAYKGADLIIVAVPTNFDGENNYFDTHCVKDVVSLALKVNPHATIVIKSTVPIGFTEGLRTANAVTLGRKPGIIFAPEFSREGRSLYDNLHPSRIIVGYDQTDELLEEDAMRFASLVSNDDAPILYMGTSEAEAVKLFANAYLAMRVAYFNELDSYAEFYGLDTKSIIEGMCYDNRIGQGYNNPSFGYGGYCFPKDTKQLRAHFKSVPNAIVRAIVNSNRLRKDFVTWSIQSRVKLGEIIGVYRLAMKAGSDNFRESAIWSILSELKYLGYRIIIYEPSIEPAEDYLGYRVTNDLAEFKRQSDIIVANRMDIELADVKDKVYTRDIYNNN